MATADLITSFLSNEMSPERERQFLLSVAASDSMRLELKSHMLLDRILLGQAQRARVPDAVRASILAAAGVGAAAAPTGTADAATASSAARAPRGGFLSRFGGRIALVIAAASCFGAGYYLGIEPAPQAAAPVLRQSNVRPTTPGAAEVTTAPSVVQPELRDTRASAPAGASRTSRPARSADASAARRAASESATQPAASVPAAAQPASELPRDPAIRTHPARGNASAVVNTRIATPTEEQRNSQSTPADPKK